MQKGKELFVTFVTEVSLYSREAEPQISTAAPRFCDWIFFFGQFGRYSCYQ